MFKFKNGNRLIYNLKSENECQLNFFDLQTNTVKENIGPCAFLKTIEYHEHELEHDLSYDLTANKLENDRNFTWYEDFSGKHIVFDEGTVATPYTDYFGGISAKLIEYDQEKYVYESYMVISSSNPSAHSDVTVIRRLSDEKFIQLGKVFHKDIHLEDLNMDNGILTLPYTHMVVDLVSFEIQWQIVWNQEKYYVASKSPETGTKGTYLIRRRDKKNLKLSEEKVMSLNNQLSFSFNNGILAIGGVNRKVDLDRFDAEIRFAMVRGKGDAVLDEQGSKVDAFKDLMEKRDLKDWVKESIEHPEDFTEILDPEVRDIITEGLVMKRSIAILGKAGVGKTSAIRAFAREVGLGNIAGIPRTTKIIDLKMANFASGTKFVGTIEKAIATIVKAAREEGVIFFIDELHSMKGIGTSSEQSNDVTQYIKTPLERGEMIIIGTDTTSEFNTAFSQDPAFKQRFKQVVVKAPSGQDLFNILRKRIQSEGLWMPDGDVLQAAIEYSNQYSLTTAQPRAAINLIRTGFAKIIARGLDQPLDMNILRAAVQADYRVNPAEFERSLMRKKLKKGFDESLEREVIGQKRAKSAIKKMWRRKVTNTGDDTTLNSVLLVGPPGIGKSSIAELSAKLMGYEKSVIHMNQFATAFDVETFRSEVHAALDDHPIRVLIFDEIEKAHPKVQQAVLEMLERGEFTVQRKLNSGGVQVLEVSAKNAVFILTGNAASAFIVNQAQDGLEISEKRLARALIEPTETSHGIDAAILSRIVELVPMTYPSKDEFKKGLKHYLDRTLKRESEKKGVRFTLKNEKEFIQALGDYHTADSEFRDVKKLIINTIEKGIVNAVLEDDFDDQDEIMLDWDVDEWPNKPGSSANLDSFSNMYL